MALRWACSSATLMPLLMNRVTSLDGERPEAGDEYTRMSSNPKAS